MTAGLPRERESRRIQRKRIKGWKMPPNTVYVGRPTQWGNPIQRSGWRWVEHSFAFEARGDAARVPPSQDSPERLLADWRAQDAALAEIWDELGIDRHVGPSGPEEIAQLTIEALRAARVRPATPQGWQPIETAPMVPILLSDGDNFAVSCWRSGWHPHPSFIPTHWMPLPAAPATPQEK